MRAALDNDLTLTNKFQHLIDKDEFDCSQAFVMSLPFEVVKRWQQNSWHSLNTWMQPLKKHNANVERSTIVNVQLWRISGDMNILWVMTRSSAQGKKSQVIYINAQDIIRDFTHELWIFDHFKFLSNVRSYCGTTLGDGSALKVGSATQHMSAIPDPWPNPA
jgi:hypothetical protein